MGRSYPEYKESGLPWLGRIPEHWAVHRNGHLFTQRKENGLDNLPILEVSLRTGVRVRDMDNIRRKQVMSDREQYKCAVRGDIAYNMMRMWQGAVGVVPEDGLISPAYVVATPCARTNAKYFSYLFRTDAYKNEIDGYSRGIVKDRNRLYWEDFKRMSSCYPSREEQKAIADYLDTNAAIVNRFIRNRQRLIELLNEQKQAVINQAVTRGLDPNARLKPSGIDWLGDIPEHWRVGPLKRLCSMKSGEGITSLQIKKIGKYPVYGGNGLRGYADSYTKNGKFVLVGRQGALCGNVHVVSGKFWASEHAVVVTPIGEVDIDWLAALLKTMNLNQYSISAAQPGLSVERLLNLKVPITPSTEQNTIADFINNHSRPIQVLTLHCNREMTLIQEYRTRLISDAVTGKIDLRSTSAKTQKKRPKRPANVHFRRAVFAAEIAHRLHTEPTLGHVKFEKLIFLCEKHCAIDIGSNYHRDAAGPYDNRALRSIDSQMKKQKWYKSEKGDKGYRYKPLENAGGHVDYFHRYFGNVHKRFDEIIDMFRKARTEQCEIVATLYGAWEDLLAQGNASDDDIIDQVLHHWHPSKQAIDEQRWRRALAWMKEQGLGPITTTPVDDQLQEDTEESIRC